MPQLTSDRQNVASSAASAKSRLGVWVKPPPMQKPLTMALRFSGRFMISHAMPSSLSILMVWYAWPVLVPLPGRIRLFVDAGGRRRASRSPVFSPRRCRSALHSAGEPSDVAHQRVEISIFIYLAR